MLSEANDDGSDDERLFYGIRGTIEEKEEDDGDNLPNTTSLPSYTATLRAPREKLTTVLKQSERLLRSTLPALPKSAVSIPRRRLDTFIMSLKEEKIQKEILQQVVKPSVTKLAASLPKALLNLTPRLSADNSPGDTFEIVVSSGEKGKMQTSHQNLALNFVKNSISPRIKKASIIKLNEELDGRIKQQLNVTLEERNAAKEATRLANRKLEEEREELDEFGLSDKESIGEEESLNLKDNQASLDKETLKELRISMKSRLVSTDDDSDILLDPKDYFSVDNNIKGFKSKPKIVPKIDEDDDEFLLTNLLANDHQLKEFNPDGNYLTQMLSGKFPSEREVKVGADETGHSETKKNDDLKFTPSDQSTSLVDDDSGGDDFESSEDYKSGVNKGQIRGEGLIDEEAEDEDSQVSADELDEEAIAKELKESKFLNDDDDEASQVDESEQLALHRQIRLEDEALEMEMFMNRFVPEKVLRETGTFAELRKKYSEKSLDILNDDKASLEGSVSKPSSKFGKVKLLHHQAITPAQSHPDFLKLLEQDLLLSSETEPETEISTVETETEEEQEQYQEQEQEREGMIGAVSDPSLTPKAKRMDSLLDSLIPIDSTNCTNIPGTGKRGNFSINDEQLKARLFTNIGREKEEASTNNDNNNSKRNRTTFETVSSRPIILKEKIGKK